MDEKTKIFAWSFLICPILFALGQASSLSGFIFLLGEWIIYLALVMFSVTVVLLSDRMQPTALLSRGKRQAFAGIVWLFCFLFMIKMTANIDYALIGGLSGLFSVPLAAALYYFFGLNLGFLEVRRRQRTRS